MAKPDYLIGLDLGQTGEFTALVVVEQLGQEEESVFNVRQLKRYQPGTGYRKILDDVAGLIEKGPLEDLNPTLIVDGTSAGAAVVQMFRSRLAGSCSDLQPVLISAGDTDTRDADWWRIPKRDLVSAVQATLQSGRLKIAKELPEAPTLIRELEQFKTKIVAASSTDALVAWREGANDDLVLALALAVWVGLSHRYIRVLSMDDWSWR